MTTLYTINTTSRILYCPDCGGCIVPGIALNCDPWRNTGETLGPDVIPWNLRDASGVK